MKRIAGIDVHKSFLEVAYRGDDGEVLTLTVPYTLDGVAGLIRLLRRMGVSEVYMESTGSYYYPLYYALKGAEIRACVLNAYKTRKPEPNKTDRGDAVWLLKLGESGLFSGSYIPEDHIMILRFLTRERFKLVDKIADFKRKLHALLWRLGMRAHGLTRKLRSKKRRSLLYSILTSNVNDSELGDDELRAVRDLINKSSMKAYVAVGIIYLKTIEYLESQLRRIDALIDLYAKDLEGEISILMSIPGISRVLAIAILAEIGDINRFPNKNKLASYAGLSPTVKSSGGKLKSSKPSKKSNKYLRRYMFLAAIAAVRSKSPRIRGMVSRLRNRGKHFKVIVIAVARKLLTIIWCLLSRNNFWREEDYSKSIRFRRSRGKFGMRISEAIEILKRAGYEVRKIND